jgi:hypothetical protein
MEPRVEGHYSIYHLHNYPYQIPEPSPGNDFLKKSEHIDKIGMNWAIKNIIDKDVNLIKGDIVIIHEIDSKWYSFIELIFDGVELVNLLHIDDEMAILPKSFKVIQSGFPIDYWEKSHNDDLSYKEDFEYFECFNYKSVVWFDHKLVKDQCLSNIKFTEDEIETTFEFNNITYTIILDWECSNIKPNCDVNDLDKFTKLLSGDDDIIFTSYSINMDMDMIDIKTTLFMSYELNKF